MKIGNAKVRLVPLTMDSLFHDYLPKHLTFIGTSEVRFHLYDCADFPNNDAPKGIMAEIKLIPDLPTPMGQTDLARTAARLRLIRDRTGLTSFGDVAKVLSKRHRNRFVPFQAAKFDPMWNASEKVEIRFRTQMIPFVVRLVDPNPALPDPDICVLSIPAGGFFVARVRGYCSETPKVPSRRIVQSVWSPSDLDNDHAFSIWIAEFQEASTNPKSPFYKRSFFSSQHSYRKSILHRMQSRGLPK